MTGKTLTALLIAVIIVFAMPLLLGILGSVFGLFVGIFGALVGVIVGIFGAVFGLIASLFHSVFGWNWGFFGFNFFSILLVAVLVALVIRRSR